MTTTAKDLIQSWIWSDDYDFAWVYQHERSRNNRRRTVQTICNSDLSMDLTFMQCVDIARKQYSFVWMLNKGNIGEYGGSDYWQVCEPNAEGALPFTQYYFG